MPATELNIPPELAKVSVAVAPTYLPVPAPTKFAESSDTEGPEVIDMVADKSDVQLAKWVHARSLCVASIQLAWSAVCCAAVPRATPPPAGMPSFSASPKVRVFL